MGLINADVMMGALSSYRLCWISGRFGGGKTSLAYKLAQNYLEKGYRLITNNKSVWSDDPAKVDLLDTGMLKAVVLLDEGGLWFKASKQIEMIASYAAKMDCIYILPSFWAPTRAAQVLVCQPLFNFKGTGLPIIVYRWRVKLGGFDDSGIFFWFKPSEIYGVYSRQDPGDTGADIVNWLIEKTEKFRGRYGRNNRLSSLEEAREDTEITEIDRLEDAVGQLASTVDQYSTVQIRKSSRRRF